MNIGSPWSPGGHGRRTGRCRDEREAAIAVKEEKREMEGEITESLRNRMFRIMLDNGRKMIGYTAGKKVEGSPYDLDRGRIVYRLR